MMEPIDISVIICTYNRSALLPDVLRSVLHQTVAGINYEVIVVDNNSTDDTRMVIHSFMDSGAGKLQYLFEGKQGVSHARNAAIEKARAPILAFTDDDVLVAPDWVATIQRAFEEYPEVGFVGGKVLPRWLSKPPSWLTPAHWSPLALQDYGNSPILLNSETTIGLVAANLAFRRSVIDEVGNFVADLQRCEDQIGSLEDHELLLRAIHAGKQGLYYPALSVIAPVDPERATRRYHRRWHRGHGYFYAKLREPSMERGAAHLFGIPSHLYRQFLVDSVLSLKDALFGSAGAALLRYDRMWFFLGFFKKRVADFNAERKHNLLREVFQFIANCGLLVRTK
jgi:glycosyltransferase involved in cell wall biosynthesis